MSEQLAASQEEAPQPQQDSNAVSDDALTVAELRRMSELNRLELDKLRRERGDYRVSDDQGADDWKRTWDEAQTRGGKLTIEESPTEEGQPRDADGKFAAKGKAEPEPVAEPEPLLPPDHEHWNRTKEAVEFLGRDNVQKIAESFSATGIDLLPGMTKAVAELPNSAFVALALVREPQAVEWLNNLAERSPGQAKRELEKISRWVAGEEESTAQAAAPQTRAPKPITPITKASSADTGTLRDDLNVDEWQKRFLAQRSNR